MEELTKEQLEIERLKIQIESEKKPLYKKLSFYSALSPIAVSIVAIVYSLSTGFFETESKLLDLRKENLKYEIGLFVDQKDSLLNTIKQLKNDRDSILIENKRLKDTNGKLTILSNRLGSEHRELNNQILILKDSISTKQIKLNEISSKYAKLESDKVLLASKIKGLEEAIKPQLESDENTREVFKDILKILDENLGGFSGSEMLLLFGN